MLGTALYIPVHKKEDLMSSGLNPNDIPTGEFGMITSSL
jgi:hypothetical protein